MKYERKLNARGSAIVGAIIWVVLGVLLFLFPDQVKNVIMLIVGGGAVLIGVVRFVIGYKKVADDSTKFLDYGLGVIFLVIGILIIIFRGSLLAILPVIFGICLLVSAITKIIDSLEMRKVSASNWWFSLIFAIVSAVFGLILIARPSFVIDLSFRLIGAFLAVDGIMNIISSSAVGYQYRNVRKTVSKTVYDAATGKVSDERDDQ